ncbi:MAG: amino acid adenylation domain-containing protein, partial [Acidobacteriota bacterium]
LTWGELELRVRALCEGLTTAGIVPGTRVAVYLDRRPEAIVAFLAILRLGAVYLPVDPATPIKRLTQMLEPLPDLRLVTSSDLEARLSALELGPIVVADRQARASTEGSGLVADVADDLPAYVMFTSGSTGTPDVVVVSRRSVMRYSRALESSFHLERGDVCLHTAAFSFSASIRQLLGPLTAGATLALASEEARHDPFLLLQRMRAWKVTVWDTVPSVWRIVEQVISTLAERDEATQVPESLRRIFLTGEPLSWDLVRAWRRHLHSGVEIRNLYSQTETAGTVSAFEVPQDCSDYDGSVPLGEPLPGVDLLLLDEQLNRVARGAEGEIFVASDRLADGYLHDDPSSRKRFLRNFTVGDRSYDRVYRTGDIARLGADGRLMPAGRRDHRVKIRGFRVDLGEVEAELERDGRVDQAVVTTEATEGGLQLVAHVIPAGKPAPSVEQIRDRLREHLPAYAVPGWIELESRFPTTPSGKIDRGVLTDRRRRQSSSAPGPVAADDAIGSLLSIWQRLLGYGGARPEDDFFAHGGDSLVAISLFLEIEQRFGVRLPPSTLFTTATVRGLASLLRRDEPEAVSESVLTLQEGGNLPPLFLVHTLWEHLPHFRDLVALLDPELPVYALEPTRDHRDLSRDTDLKQLIESYVRDIREVCPGGPYFLAGWSIGGLMAYSVAVELEKTGDRPQRVLLIDSASPALRPQIRSAGGRGEFAWLRHGQRLIERQLRSFQLTPREQLERMRWVWSEARRRMGEWIRRPPGF